MREIYIVDIIKRDTILVVAPLLTSAHNKEYRLLNDWILADIDWENFWWRYFEEIFAKVILYDRANNLVEKGLFAMNDELLRIVQEEKPEYVLFWDINEHFILPETLEKIRRNGSKTVIYLGDELTFFEPVSRYLIPCMDYIIIVDDVLTLKKYSKYGATAFFTPHGANPEIFRKPHKTKYKYDVIFVGAKKYDRAEMIDAIKNVGISVQTFGSGWENSKKVSFEELNAICGSAKINLNFTKSQDGRKHLKGRTMETPLTGGFMLTEYIPGLENIFEIGPGKEIDCFETAEECIEKIKYYLAHEEEREAMANRTYERAINNYTCEKVFRKMIDMIESPGDPYRNHRREPIDSTPEENARRLGRKVIYAVVFYLDIGRCLQWKDFMQECEAFIKKYDVKDKKILLMYNTMKYLPYSIGKRVVQYGYNLYYNTK